MIEHNIDSHIAISRRDQRMEWAGMWLHRAKKKIAVKNPEPVLRLLSRLCMQSLYRIESEGFEKIPETGPVLIIANHVSYMDGALIQSACNRPIRFIIDKWIYRLPFIYFLMRHNRAIPIAASKEDVTNALNKISEGLEHGDVICIFPEGRITFSGHLGRFKPGIEWIIDRDPTPIYPVTIEGLWGSIFSRKHRKSIFRFVPRRIRPTIKIKCGKYDLSRKSNGRVTSSGHSGDAA